MKRLKLIQFVILLFFVEPLLGQGQLDDIDDQIESAHQKDVESSFRRLLDQVDKRVLGQYRVRVDLPNSGVIWVKAVEYVTPKVVVEARLLKSWTLFIENCRSDPRAARRMLERVWNEQAERGSLVEDLTCLLPFLYLEIDKEFQFKEKFPTYSSIETHYSRCQDLGKIFVTIQP